MPDLGHLHPIVVHFAIGLLVAGVALRWLSLTGRLRFAGPAAALLLLVGTLAAAVAVQSGDDAHGPAEAIPGARNAVEEHEEWGERTRNVFLVVAVLELAILAASRRRSDDGRPGRLARGLAVASALVGLAGGWVLYEAGEHGGELVYSYAGGVGTRTGEPADVGRLLLAGLHHQARLDREAGRHAEAAALIALMAERFPDQPEVRLARIESLLEDVGDAAGALALLQQTPPPPGRFGALRHGLLTAQALKASGRRDEGLEVLKRLAAEYPDSRRLQALQKDY